ncbi:MAG: amidohydrolase family protein [Paracoccaceae bacterium]
MSDILFRNIRLLDGDGADGLTRPCDLSIKDGKIADIGSNLDAEDHNEVIDGAGNLLMPGLINGHFHSAVNHMKGRLPSLPLEVFMLYECPELEILRPTPREAYLRTMLGCIEMLRAGTTSVQDDCFFVPSPDPDIIDAVAQAYVDSGMRARLALDQPELSELEKLPYLRELLPEHLKAELSVPTGAPAPMLLEAYDHLINRWHGAADGRVLAAVSCSAPQRVSPDYFVQLDDLSLRHDLPFYAHMLETRLQRVFGEKCLQGRSLVKYTHDLGLLSDRMNVIHAIWVDDEDLDLLAASGAAVAHNPNSNLRLGSGIMRWRDMHDRGIPVCLGVDETIADDAINMWSVMKTASVLHNLTDWDYERWPRAQEVLKAATETGGQAMRVPGLGTLAVGAPADLVLVDLTALPFVPLNNVVRQLVHCELGQSVLLTMVAGQVVARDGHLTQIDDAAIIAEAAAFFAGKKAALDMADEKVGKFLPYYRKMYLKAGQEPLPIERRLNQSVGESGLTY